MKYDPAPRGTQPTRDSASNARRHEGLDSGIKNTRRPRGTRAGPSPLRPTHRTCEHVGMAPTRRPFVKIERGKLGARRRPSKVPLPHRTSTNITDTQHSPQPITIQNMNTAPVRTHWGLIPIEPRPQFYLIHTSIHTLKVTNWRMFVEISTNIPRRYCRSTRRPAGRAMLAQPDPQLALALCWPAIHQLR